MRILCLVWAPFGHRMDELAEILGGTRANLTILYGPRYLAPIRYVALTFWTLILLLTKSPEVVYAQNPPVFCPLVCLFYARLSGKSLVIDHHSIWSVKTLGGGLLSSFIGSLETFVARSAKANTAPHSTWGRSLSEMGSGRVVVIHDFVTKNPYSRDEEIRKKYADIGIISIASHGGHPLERMEVESQAVGSVPSVSLLICGPEEKLRSRLSAGLPSNVKYVGFLEPEEYLKLKTSADFALNITDEPHTLSHVLYEYAASSLPVISSRQEVVEEVFGESVLYADSSAVSEVTDKVKLFAGDPRTLADYRRRITEKYHELAKMRGEEERRLKSLLL